MSIPIEREDPVLDGAEACALCLSRYTAWWTALPDREPGEQVACCAPCARERQPADVPTKAAWFAALRGRR